MADTSCTRSSRSSRGCSDGYSLTEVLVALVVSGLLVGAAMSVTLSSRQGYDSDQNRTHVNQNLRSALDIIGVDIRQAGERLPIDFPAIMVVDGDNGAPDQVVLRRNLLDEVLPICRRLRGGNVDDKLTVARDDSNAPSGCLPLADEDGNGFPDNIDAWRNLRDSLNGATWVYTYNPVRRDGQWVLYDGDGTTNFKFHKGDTAAWNFNYNVKQNCRLYMLRQRSYRLEGHTLQFMEDQDASTPVNLSTDIVDFQVRGVKSDGTLVDTLDSDDLWNELKAIEVSLTGHTEFEGRTVTRTVSARFFPRNVLSHG